MHTLRIVVMVALLLSMSAVFMVPAIHAQIPDKFTNLKVLPKETMTPCYAY